MSSLEIPSLKPVTKHLGLLRDATQRLCGSNRQRLRPGRHCARALQVRCMDSTAVNYQRDATLLGRCVFAACSHGIMCCSHGIIYAVYTSPWAASSGHRPLVRRPLLLLQCTRSTEGVTYDARTSEYDTTSIRVTQTNKMYCFSALSAVRFLHHQVTRICKSPVHNRPPSRSRPRAHSEQEANCPTQLTNCPTQLTNRPSASNHFPTAQLPTAQSRSLQSTRGFGRVIWPKLGILHRFERSAFFRVHPTCSKPMWRDGLSSLTAPTIRMMRRGLTR